MGSPQVLTLSNGINNIQQRFSDDAKTALVLQFDKGTLKEWHIEFRSVTIFIMLSKIYQKVDKGLINIDMKKIFVSFYFCLLPNLWYLACLIYLKDTPDRPFVISFKCKAWDQEVWYLFNSLSI